MLRGRLLLRQGEPDVRAVRRHVHGSVRQRGRRDAPGNPLHPTQIYLSINAFLIFLILQWAYRRKTFDGEVFWLYVLLYAITRGILEIWRGDLVRGFVIPGILSTSQFIGLLAGRRWRDRHAVLTRAAPRAAQRRNDPCSAGSRWDPRPPEPGSTSFSRPPARDLSRSRIQKLIEEGAVRIDGAVPKRSHTVRAGEEVSVEVPEPRAVALEAEDIPLSILYEDEHLIAIDKPPGLVVHPSPGHCSGTLVNALLHHVRDLAGIGGELRPGIVHRLDRDTSGVLLVAKTDLAHQMLSRQMRRRTLGKEYLALAAGVPRVRKGEVSFAIGRDPRDRKKMKAFRAQAGDTPAGARDARTLYEIERDWFALGLTLLRCRLVTGRTHQIRVHLAARGAPGRGRPGVREGTLSARSEPRAETKARDLSAAGPPCRARRLPPPGDPGADRDRGAASTGLRRPSGGDRRGRNRIRNRAMKEKIPCTKGATCCSCASMAGSTSSTARLLRRR